MALPGRAGSFRCRWHFVLPGLIFIIGLVLRLQGTTFALPTISYDEGNILDTVWQMVMR